MMTTTRNSRPATRKSKVSRNTKVRTGRKAEESARTEKSATGVPSSRQRRKPAKDRTIMSDSPTNIEQALEEELAEEQLMVSLRCIETPDSSPEELYGGSTVAVKKVEDVPVGELFQCFHKAIFDSSQPDYVGEFKKMEDIKHPKGFTLADWARRSVCGPNYLCRYTGKVCLPKCTCWFKFKLNIVDSLSNGFMFDDEYNPIAVKELRSYEMGEQSVFVLEGLLESWREFRHYFTSRFDDPNRDYSNNRTFIMLNPMLHCDNVKFQVRVNDGYFTVLEKSTNESHTYLKVPLIDYNVLQYDANEVWCIAEISGQSFHREVLLNEMVGHTSVKALVGKDVKNVRNKISYIAHKSGMMFSPELAQMTDTMLEEAISGATKQAEVYSNELGATKLDRHKVARMDIEHSSLTPFENIRVEFKIRPWRALAMGLGTMVTAGLSYRYLMKSARGEDLESIMTNFTKFTVLTTVSYSIFGRLFDVKVLDIKLNSLQSDRDFLFVKTYCQKIHDGVNGIFNMVNRFFQVRTGVYDGGLDNVIDPIYYVEDTCCDDYDEVEMADIDDTARIGTASCLECKQGPLVPLLGYGVRRAKPYWPRMCFHNEIQALKGRVLNPVMHPQGAWTRAYKGWEKYIIDSDFIDISDWDEFLHHVRGGKKQNYRDARDEGCRIAYLMNASTKGFLKPEFNIGKAEGTVISRFISGKGDEYAVEVGLYIWPLTNYLKLGAFSVKMRRKFMYAGGSTAEELGALVHEMEIEGWFVYENDFSKWDGHLTMEAIANEMKFYGLFGFPEHVMALLQTQLKSTGRTMKGGIKFKIDGKRASGVPNTSIGNTILNFVAHSWVLRKHEFKILCMGDDCIIFTRTELDVVRLQKDFLECFGLKSKIFERTYDTLEFCSAKFWRNHGTRIMGPKPGRILARTFYDKTGRLPAKSRVKLLRGQVVGLAPAASYTPILNVVIPHMKSILGYGKLIRPKTWEGKVRASKHAFDPGVYHQVEAIYGIDEEDIHRFTDYVKTVPLGSLLDHPVLDRIIAVDLGEELVDWEGRVSSIPIKGDEVSQLENTNFIEWAKFLANFIGVPFLEEAFKVAAYPWGAFVLAAIESYNLAEGLFSFLYRWFLHHNFTEVSRCNLLLGVSGHLFNNVNACIRSAAGLNVYEIAKKNNSNKRNPQRARGKKSRQSRGSGNNVNLKNMLSSAVASGLRNGLGAVGGYLGGPIGHGIGRSAGGFISKVTGFGDYNISGNVLVAGSPVPKFSSNRNTHCVTIQHREFMKDISGSTSFVANEYVINPGLNESFPWLAGIAQKFEEYRIVGMIYEFVSTSADALNSVNTALGTVIMSTQYNVYRPSFSSKLEMENYEFTISGRPSIDHIHPIECNPKEKIMEVQYVRTGDIEEGQDLRLYDAGKFTLATVGMQATATIGELWCSYVVELYKPLLSPSYGLSGVYSSFTGTTYTNAAPFGATDPDEIGNLGVTIDAATNTLTLPDWITGSEVYVVTTWVGTSTASLTIVATVSGMSGYNNFKSGTGSSYNNNGGTGTTYFRWNCYTVDAGVSTIVYSGATLPTSGTGFDVYVTVI